MNWERLRQGAIVFFRRLLEKRKLVLVGLGILIFGFTQLTLFKEFVFFQAIEAKLVDWRYRLRPIQKPNTNIVLVGISPSSLDLTAMSEEEIERSPILSEMKKPFAQWNREIYAEVLKKLIGSGASVVVFDIMFTGKAAGNKKFTEQIEKFQDQVVLGSMFSRQLEDRTERLVYLTPEQTLFLTPNLPVAGFVNIWPDIIDGVIRRGRYKSSQLREFGKPDDAEDLMALSALAVKKFLGKLTTPNYYHSNFINFSGPAANYSIYPIEYLLTEDEPGKSKPYDSNKLFKDKIVIIGAADEILKDQHMTPLGMMFGLEIQANMVSTLLTNSSLREWPAWSDTVITFLVIALAVGIGVGISNVSIKVGLWSLLGVGFSVFAWWLFVKEGIVIALFPPFLGFLGVSLPGSVLDFASEQSERMRVNRVLNRYVAPNVVQLILNERETFLSSLKGTKRAVTVLFSDLRSFTTLTEKAESEVLVSQLNEYFTKMVEIVLKKEGTLHKFIGDSLMAVWGDTHSRGLEKDARSAVEAALEMEKALKELNEQWKLTNQPLLQMGIGIDHGVVIVGNIGHPERMEFTVLGNAVNTASRIEGETKRYQISTLVSDEVQHLTQTWFDYHLVDEVQLRGKAKALKLYQPLSKKVDR